MKTVVALSDQNKALKLMEGGAVDKNVFKLAADIVAVIGDNPKNTSAIVSQMFPSGTYTPKDGEYLVVAVEFDANRNKRETGKEDIQYDIVQCLPMAVAQSMAEREMEFRNARKECGHGHVHGRMAPRPQPRPMR